MLLSVNIWTWIFQQYASFWQVRVELLDVNDNWPVFDEPEYEGSIREDSLPGTVVATVMARDADQESRPHRLEYFIMSGDAANQFAVSADGKVYTRLMLDAEVCKVFWL